MVLVPLRYPNLTPTEKKCCKRAGPTCGMVLVSRRAGRPVAGSVVFTQSAMTDSGDSGVPLGRKFSVGGSVSGSSDSGIATGS